MSPLELSAIYKKDEGAWVAHGEDNQSVYGAGRTVEEAVTQAKASGHPDFTLLFVEPSETLYCGRV